jgi:integral membrane protein
MMKLLRWTAIAEGISYLAFALTMPLKYMLDIIWPNKIVGIAHGFLFIAFCLLVVIAANKDKWNFKKTFILLLSSLIPFGTFWAEKEYLRDKQKKSDTLDSFV